MAEKKSRKKKAEPLPEKPAFEQNPMTGTKLYLQQLTPIYKTATSVLPIAKLTGPVYVWAAARVNGRLRVCKNYSEVSVPGRIYGFIDWRDENEQ